MPIVENQSEGDIADMLAIQWNIASSQSDAEARDFWPVCSILADDGLLYGTEEQLTTVRIGPYRLAQTAYKGAVRDFLEVFLPGAIAGAATGSPLKATVSGVLSGLTRTFLNILRRGVIFSRTAEDFTRWEVLIHIKGINAGGHQPTEEDVVNFFASNGARRARTAAEIGRAVADLQHMTSAAGTEVPLVDKDPDGGLRCLV